MRERVGGGCLPPTVGSLCIFGLEIRALLHTDSQEMHQESNTVADEVS